MTGPARRVRQQIGARSFNTVTPRVQPILSAITVAGVPASNSSCSRIFGSTASTIDPAGLRSYFGAASDAIAARTVFLGTPEFVKVAEASGSYAAAVVASGS